MSEHLLILVGTVLANNFVLVRFLGLCPFMGVSNKLEGAMGMAVATAFVLTLSSVSSYLLHQYLLKPLHLEYLSTLSFILVIAVTVQLTEMFMRKSSPCTVPGTGDFSATDHQQLRSTGCCIVECPGAAQPAAIGFVRVWCSGGFWNCTGILCCHA